MSAGEPDTRFELRHPYRIRSARSRTIARSSFAIAALEIETLPGEAWHDLSSDHSTLSIVLGQTGGRAEPRLRLDRPFGREASLRYANYVPAGAPVWGYTKSLRTLRELRVTFDCERIADVLGEEVDAARVTAPMLMLSDERLFAVGELLFAECLAPDPLSPLYVEGLITALLKGLRRHGSHAGPATPHGALAPWQLRRVTDFIDAHVSASISLNSLAELTGLSVSRFGRGFRAATGMSPHQWLLNARVQRAQALLLHDDLPLADIALAAGFSEQSHFNRTFRRLTGSTPGRWRRDRGGRRV